MTMEIPETSVERCLFDPLALARRKAGRCHMASSYDRRGGNHDWSSYIRREGGAAVLMEAEGPGCITRIWTADPQEGTLRIFLDGDPVPAIEAPFRELFALLPLSSGIGGEAPANYARSVQEELPMGHTSYCPIPFQRSCKVTIDPEDDYLYYQINWHAYPVETPIETYRAGAPLTTPSTESAESAWSQVAANEPLLSWEGAEQSELRLPPGESEVLFTQQGAGIVRGIQLAVAPGETDAITAHLRDNLWLTIHCDDDEQRDPSVRAPVGPFFLNFGQEREPQSFLIGTDSEGAGYCFFAMPHATGIRIQIENRGVLPAESITFSAIHESLDSLPADLFRFRASWHVETPFGPDHRDYGGVACRLLNLDGRDNVELLSVRGAGHFVGCGFHADLRDAPTDRACGEGDEMFFIDDDPRLTLYGTGTEDYVNDAWGVRGYRGPLSGDALSGKWGVNPQLFGYRLHLSDCIPFIRKGRFTLEHGTGNNSSGLYRSVAYWYMDPENTRIRTEEWRWEEIRNARGKGAGGL